MAESSNRQGEVNPAPCLATQVPSDPLGIPCIGPTKNLSFWPYYKSFVDQACSVKMAGYWPCSFLHFHSGAPRVHNHT